MRKAVVMTLDLGLYDMQSNKRNGKAIFTIVFIALVALLFIGAGISATENDKQKNASTEEKSKEAPVIFQPTEKVTADQAVAFPTDI